MNMQWPIFLFALFLAAKVNAQEPMNVPSLALPSNPCTYSDEAVSRYFEPISQLKEKLEEEKQRIMDQGVDEAAMIDHAFERTGYDRAELEKLAGMSESQQQAYAMKLAKEKMQNPVYVYSEAETAEIKAQLEMGQRQATDQEAFVRLMMPSGLKLGELRREADIYYEQHIVPASEEQFKQEAVKYCNKFSPRQYELLRLQIAAWKKADPYMADYLESKSEEIDGLEISSMANIDAGLVFIGILEQAFEYRLTDPTKK
jgi:hypothetical protein